jgi:RecG-like helicase
MENLHLKNLTKEALFKDVHRPRLITFFNNKNLTRYNIEQLFKSFNINTSKDVITAIYEIYENEYSNKTALVNATLNYIIQITELNQNNTLKNTNDPMLKILYQRKNIRFLIILFYILSESFILKEFLKPEEIQIINKNIKKLIKHNQIIDNSETLTFVVPAIWIEPNLSTNENLKKNLKEDLKQNNNYNIIKKAYNKQTLELIENKLKEDFKEYVLKFDHAITAPETFLLNINKIPNELQELNLIEIID